MEITMINIYRTDDQILHEVHEIHEGVWVSLSAPTVAETQKMADELDIDIDDIRASLDEEESSRIELKDGYKFEEVSAAIKADPYFVNDETHVKQVPSVDALLDMGHGVNLTRKGVSGKTQNQLFEFNMRINNPALTAQVLVCVARASMKQQPGCYTMVESPVIDLLPGDREEWIGHLV